MADFDLYDDLYVFDLPELVIILSGITRTSDRPEEAHILAVASTALTRVQEALGTDDQHQVGSTASPTRRQAGVVNAEVNRRIVDMYRQIHAVGASPFHASGPAARDLLHQAFPLGLKEHTNAVWDDKRTKNRTLTDKLSRPEYSGLLQATGVQPIVDELAVLCGQFEASLMAVDAPSRVEVVDRVQDARAAASWAINTVRAAWDPRDGDGGQRRDAMLAELRGVQARLRARYARGPRKKKDCPPAEGGGTAPGSVVGGSAT